LLRILFEFCLSLQVLIGAVVQQQPSPAAPTADTLVVLAAGDVMLANWLIPVLEREGLDYPFRGVLEPLRRADLRIVNLEAPFTDGGEPFDKRFTFRVPPRLAGVLVQGQIDAVNLANNHILDFGPEGLSSTLLVLDSLGIVGFGAGRDRAEACGARYVTRGGRTIALLGFSLTYPPEFYATANRPGTCFGSCRAIRSAIQAARDSADLVIASFHWGSELRETPKPYQRELAHLAIDSGADLVIGHHPHVLQGLEIYRGKLIAYSLGNFIFASYSDRARDSALLLCTFDKTHRLKRAKVVPLNVWNRHVEFQPAILRGQEAERLFQHLNRISAGLNGGKPILSAQGEVLLLNSLPVAN